MGWQIFISYHREDAAHPAGRLNERLSARFPEAQIFIDVDNIPAGIDFVEAIKKSMESCDLLIAVIGKRWLSSADEKRRRRLNNPQDFVRLEIATALKRGIPVIPVPVDGALMPRERDLPDDLKDLVRRNALEVNHTRFSADSMRLVRAVERALDSVWVERQQKREEQESLETEQRRPGEVEWSKPERALPQGDVANLKFWPSAVVIGSGIGILLIGFSFYAWRRQPIFEK